MEELVDRLGNNVKTITFFTETREWKITYKNGLEPDTVHNEDIEDFLENA